MKIENIMDILTPKPPKGANGGDAVKFGKPNFVSLKAKNIKL